MSRKMKESLSEYAGKIPCTWNDVPIKYITTCNDDTLSESTDKDFAFEYIDISSVKYGKGIINVQPMTFEDSPSRARRIVQSNDVIISTVRTYLKAVAIIPKIEKPTIVSTGFAVLRAKKNIDSKFLQYALSNDTFVSTVEKYSNGVSYPAINSTELIKFKIPVPPLEEQQNIADFLDSKTAFIDSAIQAQKAIVEKLEEYKQAVITEAVTKGLNRDVEMKDSGIEWIGEVPSTWSVVPIKALFEERKHKNKDMQETNLLSLSYGNIKRKDINSNNGLLPENFSGYNIVETGDIVLRLTDLQNDHKSLRTGLVKEHGIITSAYVTLAPKHEVNSEYYHYLLHSYDIRKVFYTMGEGIRQSLDFGTLKKNVSILVPPTEEQKNIVEYINKKCESVENSIVRINAIIEKLEEYKKSIIYNAVTGKIDCRKDVIPE